MFANFEILDVIMDEAAIRWFLDCTLPGGGSDIFLLNLRAGSDIFFMYLRGWRSTLSSKLYKGQGLSKPTPSYDQKSISGIIECYSKMKIFFALCIKSPFLNIYNSNSNRLIILFTYCLLYILLHMYILFHHPIEELELQTLWGGQSFFLSQKWGSNIILTV